jgi:3-oxoadipate enol-lactonase
MRRYVFLFGIAACSPTERAPNERDTASAASTTGTVVVPGSTLYYERKGAGRSVVLIEGANMGLGQWDAQFDSLARHYDVVRYDVRGFGKSGYADTPYMAHDDLLDLLRHLGIAKASLVGLSLGGRIAIDFALAHPEMVEKLVLAGPGLSGFPWSRDSSVNAMSAAIQQRDSVGAAEAWLAHPYMKPAMENPQLAPRLRELAIANSRVWVAADSERVADPPAYDRLAQIKAPTLVIVGERDVPDIQRIVDRIGTTVPGAKRVTLPRVGHVVHMEAPTEFSLYVMEFLGIDPPTAAPVR